MLVHQGPSGPLQFPDGGIGIETDHETIAERLCLLQVTDMTVMNEIETTVGKDDLLALLLQGVQDLLQGGE